MLKASYNSSAEFSMNQNLFNEFLITGNFLNNFKLADITSLFKKKDFFSKENYRPVNLFLSISKISKNLMQKQINGYISHIL